MPTHRNPAEHDAYLVTAKEHVLGLRKSIKKLAWISGGKGYDNMGERELDRVRDKLDELDFWLAAASRSLYAGGQRAAALGFPMETASGEGEGA